MIYVDAHALTRLAASALEAAGLTQQAAADALGVSVGAVNRAVNWSEADATRLAKLRGRIIEHFTDQRVSGESFWRIETAADADSKSAQAALDVSVMDILDEE